MSQLNRSETRNDSSRGEGIVRNSQGTRKCCAKMSAMDRCIGMDAKVFIFGPPGAGKSTVCNMLNGYDLEGGGDLADIPKSARVVVTAGCQITDIACAFPRCITVLLLPRREQYWKQWSARDASGCRPMQCDYDGFRRASWRFDHVVDLPRALDVCQLITKILRRAAESERILLIRAGDVEQNPGMGRGGRGGGRGGSRGGRGGNGSGGQWRAKAHRNPAAVVAQAVENERDFRVVSVPARYPSARAVLPPTPVSPTPLVMPVPAPALVPPPVLSTNSVALLCPLAQPLSAAATTQAGPQPPALPPNLKVYWRCVDDSKSVPRVFDAEACLNVLLRNQRDWADTELSVVVGAWRARPS